MVVYGGPSNIQNDPIASGTISEFYFLDPPRGLGASGFRSLGGTALDPPSSLNSKPKKGIGFRVEP